MNRSKKGTGPWLAGLTSIVALAAVLAWAPAAAWGQTGGAPSAAGGPAPPTRSGAPTLNPVAGNLSLVSARTWPRKTFYFGVQQPRLRYEIGSDLPANDLRIDVVSLADGKAVKSYFRNGIAPNTADSIRWDGTGRGGRPAKNGRYAFRISPQSGEPEARRAFQRSVRQAKRRSLTSNSAPPARLNFTLYGYAFPVLGAHDFGGPGSGFGARRSGHTHQGHDLMARCGTPLIAARGGRVRFSGYHAAAGNYLVIDGRGTGFDMAYMHLLQPSPLKAGTIVRTGEMIGLVGSTGSSTACHLHFEIWTAPGWYRGGSPIDPLPYLKRWSRYS